MDFDEILAMFSPLTLTESVNLMKGTEPLLLTNRLGKNEVNSLDETCVFEVEEGLDMFDSFCSIVNSIGSHIVDKDSVFNAPLPIKIQNSRDLFNLTECEYKDCMLYDGFLTNLQKKPDSIAVIHNNLEYSYYELGLYVSTIYELIKSKNITKKDYVVILQSKGVWQIATALASMLIGSRFIPLDRDQPNVRIKKIIDKLGKVLVVGDYEISDRRSGQRC